MPIELQKRDAEWCLHLCGNFDLNLDDAFERVQYDKAGCYRLRSR
jgi:hypothetical protein